jgi:catechol 2,3-dioxygenase-like lactoylglutathione lyase family enzyme
MAQLRHFAIVVRDQEKSAKFYEQAFGMKRAGYEDLGWSSALYLTDGTINLALLNYREERGSGLKDPKGFVGAHHFGFQVDDMAETQKRIEAAGGTFFFDLGDDQDKENFERKFKDPDGIIIDISQKGWSGTAGRR